MSGATTRSPFPWLPMMAICTALVSNVYAISSLFPYVGYMVQYLGVTEDKDEAGFYTGYISSALMVGRVGSSYFWGRFSDRYGRLPAVYISLCSLVIFPVAFGMSTSFYWAIASRFLLGVLNSLVVTSKVMISEVCSKEYEVVGMSTITACLSFALVVGPGIGGLLSEPAKQYPRIFSEFGLFGRFPYLLPNFVGACIALAALTIVFFFLDETKPTQARNGTDGSDGLEPSPTPEKDTKDPVGLSKIPAVVVTHVTQTPSLDYDRGSDEGNLTSGVKGISASRNLSKTTVADGTHGIRTVAGRSPLLNDAERLLNNSESEQRRLYRPGKSYDALEAEVEAGRGDARNMCSTWCLVPMRLLSKPKIRDILFVYVLFWFIKSGFDDVYPLWALSTIVRGGLDWTANEIGKGISIAGLTLLVFQMTIYSPLIKAAGIQRSHRVSSFVMVPIFMATPLLSLLHNSGWVLTVANLVILFFHNIAANTIIVNLAITTNNAVDPSSRGTLNGIFMTAASLSRAAGPPVFSFVLAWSINRPRPFPFNCQLTFYAMAMLMAIVVFASWDIIHIPETDKNSNQEDRVTIATDKEARIDGTFNRENR